MSAPGNRKRAFSSSSGQSVIRWTERIQAHRESVFACRLGGTLEEGLATGARDDEFGLVGLPAERSAFSVLPRVDVAGAVPSLVAVARSAVVRP